MSLLENLFAWSRCIPDEFVKAQTRPPIYP